MAKLIASRDDRRTTERKGVLPLAFDEAQQPAARAIADEIARRNGLS